MPATEVQHTHLWRRVTGRLYYRCTHTNCNDYRNENAFTELERKNFDGPTRQS